MAYTVNHLQSVSLNITSKTINIVFFVMCPVLGGSPFTKI